MELKLESGMLVERKDRIHCTEQMMRSKESESGAKWETVICKTNTTNKH